MYLLVVEDVLFHCNGIGASIVWKLNGSLATDSIIGITQHTVSSSGTVQSTLTVPATLVNNGTTVQCVIYPDAVTSNTATLTVLPIPGELCRTNVLITYHTILYCTGIGQVRNVRFTSSLSDVQWDPPLTALSGLMYNVTTINMDTGQIVVNKTTNNTSCPLPTLQLCQNYTVNVTAFSSQQQGDGVATGPPGSEFFWAVYVLCQWLCFIIIRSLSV